MTDPLKPGALFMAEAEGFRTMVGFGEGEPPYESGNCFGVYRQRVTRGDVLAGAVEEYKIVNFNARNLDELIRLGLKWPIQCKLLAGRTAIIHDPRIGERWYQHRYCEVCCPARLLPVTQIQAHERAGMAGQRKDYVDCVSIDLTIEREFP